MTVRPVWLEEKTPKDMPDMGTLTPQKTISMAAMYQVRLPFWVERATIYVILSFHPYHLQASGGTKSHRESMCKTRSKSDLWVWWKPSFWQVIEFMLKKKTHGSRKKKLRPVCEKNETSAAKNTWHRAAKKKWDWAAKQVRPGQRKNKRDMEDKKR